MTEQVLKNEKTRNIAKVLYALFYLALFIISLTLSLLYPDEIKGSITNGIRLSVYTVIPALFPFMILSDYLSKIYVLNNGPIAKIVTKPFGLPVCCAPAILCGNLCGFPLGAKIISDQFNFGKIKSNQAERALGLASNPSLAFVVSGVGGGLLRNVKYGILLYITLIIATVITGILFRSNEHISNICDYNSEQNLNLANSIKQAALSCIYISSFIIFFSYVSGVMSCFIKNERIALIVSIFLEISNSAKDLARVLNENRILLPLLAFSLGFSGFSVHMQTSAMINKEIKMHYYFMEKITEGLLCMALMFIFVLFLRL